MERKEIAPHDFKVLFIYPNTMMATLIPIGLSILSTSLKAKGFTVDLFDTTYYKTEEISFEEKKMELLQVKPFSLADKGVIFKETNIYDDLVKKVETFKPDLIAVTIVEDVYELALSLLKSIEHFDIPVIAGGVFVSFSPEEVISQKNMDIINMGEGEEPLTELCEKMRKGEDYSNIPNLWVKKDGRVIKNPMRHAIDVNKLPFIDYDIFERKRLYRPMKGKIYAMVHIEVERGCPYNCTYCEAPQIKRLYRENKAGNYVRRKRADRLIAELEHLVRKYRPDYINFNAESFLAVSEEELEEFGRQYKKKIGLPFWCQTRPETVTEEKVKILKEMNCDHTQFGIEHGNEEFRRKVLNRHYTNEQLLKAMKLIEKYGISYTVNDIIGFPDETRELIFDTININRQINPTTINCYIFTPYRGTPLYNYCIEKGYLDENSKVHQLLDGAPLKMKSITYEELKGLQRTFPLYAKMPESEFWRIRIAERFDEKGNAMFEELKKEYYEKYF